MTTYLLDINVVIALIDPFHSHHDIAHRWFAAAENRKWATCAITQNGTIRILSQPTYGNALPTPAIAAEYLTRFCAHPQHQFWPDDLSLLSSSLVEMSRLLSPRQVTDTYLLGLAASREGKLATIDKRLSPVAIHNGTQYLELIT